MAGDVPDWSSLSASPQIALLSNSATGSTSGTQPVPPGAQSLSCAVIPAAGAGSAVLKVVGHTSGLLLGMVLCGGAKEPGQARFPIDATIDATIDWTLTVSSGNVAVYINALPIPAPPPAPLVTFPLHFNGPVTSAAPYTVWTITHSLVNPLAMEVYGWSISLDGAATTNCFASLHALGCFITSAIGSTGDELWNRQLINASGTVLTDVTDDTTWLRPLVLAAADATTQDLTLQWQAPVAASSYNVRGTINVGLVPWVPGLGQAVA